MPEKSNIDHLCKVMSAFKRHKDIQTPLMVKKWETHIRTSRGVSIHGLIMRGHANANRQKLVARYKDIKPYVEGALDEAIKRDKNLGVFILPSCLIDPSYLGHLSINWKKMTKEMIYISPEETIFGNLDVAQPNYCKDCLINENCSWAWESAWKEYIDMFRTNELNKITASKLRYE